MMMKNAFRVAILLVIMFGLSNCKKPKNDIFYSKKYIKEIKESRKEAFYFMSGNFIPGASFAIVKDGKLIYSEGMGLASNDLEVPVTRATKFRIGAISELFTSLIYQLMVENGTLHPDSSVQSYFPDYPKKNNKLTLDHLVQHTSGIREPNSEEQDWRGLNVTLRNGIDNFKNDTLDFQPGSYQMPSFFNYNLLGAIMETVTGKRFPVILKEYVTDTLHLENIVEDNPLKTIKGRTDFFDHNIISQLTNATTRDMRFRSPSEGLLSNAEDLALFGNAVLLSDHFSGEVKKRLVEPVILGSEFPSQMSNGWLILMDEKGEKFYGKSGSVTGGGAALLIYPQHNLVVACTTNLSVSSNDFPVFSMAKPFLPKTTSDEN